MNVIQMKSGDCNRCDGCGYVANSDDAEPWRMWANLPLSSAVAVTAGLVRPVPCPECEGSGDATQSPIEERASATPSAQLSEGDHDTNSPLPVKEDR